MITQLNGSAVDISECRVLVAEDNAMNALMVEAVLQHFGCPFEIVEAGDRAVELVKAGQADIVLLDFHMPGLNGAQAAQAIRRWEHDTGSTRVQIVGLTASAMPAEVAFCLDAGMDQVVTKPFDIEHLRRVLIKACESRAR